MRALWLGAAALAAALLGGALWAWEQVTARPGWLAGNAALVRVETAQRLLALTFEDGPAPPCTEQLLEVLERHGARATFFMLGRRVERHPELVARVRRGGHQVGSHGTTHQRLLGRSAGFIRHEVLHADAALRLAGVTGEIAFRAPYGRGLLVLPLLLEERGLPHVLADVVPDPPGRGGPSAEHLAAQVVARLHPGSIIALHDGQGACAETLGATALLLPLLQGRGWRLLTVAQLIHAAAVERGQFPPPAAARHDPRPLAALPPLRIPVPAGR